MDRLLLVASDSLDVALGSGTAMAIRRLRSALFDLGVETPTAPPDRSTRTSIGGRSRIAGSGYDAVLGVGGDGWRIARQLDVPHIALTKAMYSRALRWERGRTRLALRVRARREGEGLRRADVVIAPSRDAAAAVAHDYRVKPALIRVIPEPFDLGAWRATLPLRERNGTRVLCVAHMYPRKRVVDLIAAWRTVRAARNDVRLDVVGDGPDLRHVARVALDQPSVFLHGYVDPSDAMEFYGRADAFALPSAQETFGYAVVEALASGLPVVVAAGGALPEIVAGSEAEVVPPCDPDALAAAMLRSLDASRRARAAVRNPARAEAFDARRVASDLLAVVDAARRSR